MGDSIYYIALLTYASRFPEPSLAILLVSLSETLPGVLSVILGVLSDRTAAKARRLVATFWLRGGCCIVIGLLMGMDPAWPLLGTIVLLNFVSDVTGKYAGSLQLPFMVQVVEDRQLEQASGLNSAVQRVMGVVSQWAGSFLILWFSFRTLAWLNGATFAAGGMMLGLMLKQLIHVEKKGALRTEGEPATAKAPFWNQMKQSIVMLAANKRVFPVVIQVTLVNAALFPLSALFSMYTAVDGDFVVRSFSFSIALFSTVGSVGVFLGNLASAGLCKHTALRTIIGWSYGFVLGYCAGLILQMPILALFMYMLVCACVGLLSPKYGALFARNVDRQQLASVTGASQTLVNAGGPICNLIIGGMASGLSLNAGTLGVVILVLAGFGFLLYPARYGYKAPTRGQ